MIPSANIVFRGASTVQLDSKGRFMLPKMYKDSLPEGQKENFVLTIGFKKSLKLYPQSVWDQKMQMILNKYDWDSEEADDVKRKYGANSDHIIMDAAGKININNHLIEKVGLKKTLKIIPMIDCLEIWELEVYEKHEEGEADLAKLTKNAKEASRLNNQ
jgi:MraZ protein